jgi:hypothetical protein
MSEDHDTTCHQVFGIMYKASSVATHQAHSDVIRLDLQRVPRAGSPILVSPIFSLPEEPTKSFSSQQSPVRSPFSLSFLSFLFVFPPLPFLFIYQTNTTNTPGHRLILLRLRRWALGHAQRNLPQAVVHLLSLRSQRRLELARRVLVLADE